MVSLFLCHTLQLLLFLDEKNGNRKLSQAFIRLLSHEMCNSLLATARKQRPVKARADCMKLKEQRDEKKRKADLELQLNLEKTSYEIIETLFLYEKYENGNCWRTVDEVNEGLEKISSSTAKKCALKDNITIYVKDLRWTMHHTK